MIRIFSCRLWRSVTFRSALNPASSCSLDATGQGTLRQIRAYRGFNGYKYDSIIGVFGRRNTSQSGKSDKDRGREWRYGKTGGGLFFLQAGVWASIKNQVTGKKDEIEDRDIKEKIVAAAACCREEKFDEALAVLHDALFISEQQKHDNAINYCIDMMANIYYFIGRYDEAERAFASLIQRLVAAGPANGAASHCSPAVVELSLKLADVYAMKGDDDKAESGFEFCLEMQKANLERSIAEEKKRSFQVPGSRRHDVALNPETTDPFALYGLVLETYARYLVRKGRIDDSRMYINRALEMALEIYGSLHPHTLAVMNNFAVLCIQQQRYDVAQQYLKDVVARAPMVQEGGEFVAGYFTNYAEVLWHLGRHDEAVDYARRAAKVSSDKSVSEESKKRTESYLRTMEADWKVESKKKAKN